MKRTIKTLSMLLLAAATVFMTSCGPKKTDTNETAEEQNEAKFDSKETEKDAEFVAEVVAANFAEIQMAQLAKQKSNNTQIVEVAGQLEQEHTRLLNDLQGLASAKSFSIPMEPEENAKKKIEDLNNETDVKDFNKEWCNEMKDKHESAIKKFEARLEKTEDPDLRNWITETLPHLRAHLDQVKSCEASVSATASK